MCNNVIFHLTCFVPLLPFPSFFLSCKSHLVHAFLKLTFKYFGWLLLSRSPNISFPVSSFSYYNYCDLYILSSLVSFCVLNNASLLLRHMISPLYSCSCNILTSKGWVASICMKTPQTCIISTHSETLHFIEDINLNITIQSKPNVLLEVFIRDGV